MSAPPLPVLAGWDLPLLAGCVGTLGRVAERLQPWRARLDAVGRELAAAEVWSGAAGTAAAGALADVSGVAWSVQHALTESLSGLEGLLPDAAAAQQLAVEATAGAAHAGLSLDPGGRVAGGLPRPAPAMAPDQWAAVEDRRAAGLAAQAAAEEALAAAARVTAAAEGAGAPLVALGHAGRGPVSFADLLVGSTAGEAVAPPPVPTAGPVEVAGWWAGLSPVQQRTLLGALPAVVGALDGVPAWARDRANRVVLAQTLHTAPAGSTAARAARDVAAQLARGGSGEVRQLVQFEPARGLVALAVGDLDNAGAVAVMVPGIRTTTADLPGLAGDARDVVRAAGAAAPGLAVATLVWLGYRTPGLVSAPSPVAARVAGPALDRALDGLAATRAQPGAGPRPRTTVLAHSYGTVVTGQAVRAPGRIAADALVLLGSPGVAGGEADDLEAEEVYGAWSTADPVSWLQWFGDSPSDPSFGDAGLPTAPGQGHGHYYDRDEPTLAAIGEVVAGTR